MTLQRALLVSIALHALLLAIVRPPQGLPQETRSVTLVARLVQPVTAPEPVPAEAPRRLLKPRKIVPITPQLEPAQPAAVQPTIDEEPRAEEPQALASAEPPAAIQAGAPQLDPGAIARYRLEIISAAKQFRRYPPIARENGWQGRAEVRVRFDGAREPAVALSKSSGYAVLDRQAVETLSKALAPVPPLLAGRAFELDFPVVFSLDE